MATASRRCKIFERLFRRDAETNTRDACATQAGSLRSPDGSDHAGDNNPLFSHRQSNRFCGLLLVQPNDQAQIKEQERRREQETVDQVERPADSRQQIAGILHAGAAFHDRFGQIADDRGEPEQ